jgi:hypothetical protein
MAILDRVHEYSGLLRGLRAYFAHAPTLEEAKATIREHIERREDLFLAMARERFCVPGSPYQPLLGLAQCGYRDIEMMVRQRGLEATLDALRRAGVYLSFEEFKFGGEVRREGRVFQLDPAQFIAGQGTSLLSLRSGATRSAGTWSPRSIEHFVSGALQFAVMLAVFDDGGAPILCWLSGFPTGAGISTWFRLARLHRPALRWFSLTPMPRGMRGRHELILRTVLAVAKRAGLRLPPPEYTPVNEVGKVLDVVLKTLATSGRCLVMTPTSCAVRLSAEACRRGASLDGVQFITNGEPLTPGKAEEIRRAGAAASSRYSINEVGPVGMPCGAPIEPDDMHFLSTTLAMIPHQRQFGDLTVDALMLTSLLPTDPKLLLNVEIDDFATIDERRCGCLWDELGCRTHLARVRSFTKLTGEGTTILGSNCVHVLERVLPEAFGGSSVDYQLVEAEDQAHLTRLYLLISPRVGPLNDGAVLRRFGEALQTTERRPMGGKRPIWDEAQTIRVIRREPVATRAGKLLPFHTIGAAASMEFRIDPTS